MIFCHIWYKTCFFSFIPETQEIGNWSFLLFCVNYFAIFILFSGIWMEQFQMHSRYFYWSKMWLIIFFRHLKLYVLMQVGKTGWKKAASDGTIHVRRSSEGTARNRNQRESVSGQWASSRKLLYCKRQGRSGQWFLLRKEIKQNRGLCFKKLNELPQPSQILSLGVRTKFEVCWTQVCILKHSINISRCWW